MLAISNWSPPSILKSWLLALVSSTPPVKSNLNLVSLDNAKNWKNDLFSKKTYNNTANDYDPIIFLGKDASKYIDPKKYRMINGYMKVQSKENGKFNFLDKNKNILSPIWFTKASDMNDDKIAFVMNDDGDTFYVGSDGYYENENDDYPFMTFDEV